MMLIDGVESELVPASDRGLLYGDGLFETIAMLNGVPQLWQAHMQRLLDGCQRLGITPPDAEVLRQEVGRVAAGTKRAVAKIIITRGSGGRGYRPPLPAASRRIVSLHPWPDYPAEWYRDGVRAYLCETPLAINPHLAGVKHLNRLEQVLARGEWDAPDIAEGLMRDTTGVLVEGTMSNLFVVRDATLYTPALEQCGVAGVMRAQVLREAERLGIPSRVSRLELADLEQADEAFFTNSIIGIWPLQSLGVKEWIVGPITRRLMQSMGIGESNSDA